MESEIVAILINLVNFLHSNIFLMLKIFAVNIVADCKIFSLHYTKFQESRNIT